MKNVRTKGCLKYFQKKKKKTKGGWETNQYYSEKFRRNIEYIFCLPYIPINLIEIVWFGISRNLMRLGRTVQHINEGNIVDFCSYFTNQWVDCEIYIKHKAKIPPSNWFITNLYLTTNNLLEGINSELKKQLHGEIRDFWEFWKDYERDWARAWHNAIELEDKATLKKRSPELMAKYKVIQQIRKKLEKLGKKQQKRKIKAGGKPNNYLSDEEEKQLNDCLHQLATVTAQARKNKYLDAKDRKNLEKLDFDESQYVGLFQLDEIDFKNVDENDSRHTLPKNDKELFKQQMKDFLYGEYGSNKKKTNSKSDTKSNLNSDSNSESNVKGFKVNDERSI